MQLSKESKERIKKAYIGDLHWLETIQEELQDYEKTTLCKSDVAYDWEEFERAEKLLYSIFKMNYIIMETETESYAEKYYTQAHELYAEMKVDLTEILNISELWEEI